MNHFNIHKHMRSQISGRCNGGQVQERVTGDQEAKRRSANEDAQHLEEIVVLVDGLVPEGGLHVAGLVHNLNGKDLFRRTVFASEFAQSVLADDSSLYCRALIHGELLNGHALVCRLAHVERRQVFGLGGGVVGRCNSWALGGGAELRLALRLYNGLRGCRYGGRNLNRDRTEVGNKDIRW